MSPAGKEVAGKGPSGGREAPSCQHRKIRPVVQVSGPRTCLDTEPICPLKRKKKRRMEETEEGCSGLELCLALGLQIVGKG